MPKFLEIKPVDTAYLEKIGFSWHRDISQDYIVQEKLLVISHQEADAYENAANEIYKMYESGAQYVIKNNLFDALDIPPHLVESIKKSWIDERDNHLYGRFDLSGGIDGEDIKLIEFNADTPTLLLESAVVQWMQLEFNEFEEKKQFNRIYEAIGKSFLKIAGSDKALFSKFLFSSVESSSEEINTVKLLESMAKDSGLLTKFSYLEEISFDAQTILDENENSFDFWFKLYPWEEMESFEPTLQTKLLNPAFTLLYQSKGMLAILYKLFPKSPYLLETSFLPLTQKYVKKQMFGREGANIDIVEDGRVVRTTDGIYDAYKSIYQEYVSFTQDDEGKYYQAGVFYSHGACGVGFRRGAEILDNMSQFIGHIIKEDK